jgi:hypothetical protein
MALHAVGRKWNLRSVDLASGPWVHHNDLHGNGLLQPRPILLGQIRNVYAEKLRVLSNEILGDASRKGVYIDQSPDDALVLDLCNRASMP